MGHDSYLPWWRKGEYATRLLNPKPAPLPNQIGLEGSITPPQFMAGAKLDEDTRDRSKKKLIDWSWLRIERHFGFHFDEQETAIELRLPWSRRYGRNSAAKDPRMSRSYVLVFGRAHTRLTKGAWHMRGAPAYWDSYFL